MKVFVFILLNIFLQFNSLNDNLKSYDNAQKCVSHVPEYEDDCYDIPCDYTDHDPVQCCYVTYKIDEEGTNKKCVPIIKTVNGLYMYEQQLLNIGASSITILCSSQRTIISLLMLGIFVLLL